MDTKIKAGIIGAAGYTGGETIRLLLNHPNAELAFAQSRSQEGKLLTDVHRDLIGDTHLRFTCSAEAPADVIFLCLGHGESRKFLAENNFPPAVRIIDLTSDFRLGGTAGEREFIYGLPELNRESIRTARNIANPGCFATAIQLGLLPLANARILGEVHTTGITGSTGAGQKLQDTTHFSWRAENISAYKTLTHQHIGEIHKSLGQLQLGFTGPVNFVPWRGNFTRGIFATSVLACALPLEEAYRLFEDYYAGHPFTLVSRTAIDMKQAVNTNKCIVHLEAAGAKLAVHTVLDNLIKGASGQAIQNMNIMFEADETAGLNLKASAF